MDELIERDAERAALDEALDAAKHGTGRLLVIEAAPGLGKTRLLRTLQDRSDTRVLKARGSELESKFAFGVVHQLLDAVVLAAPDTVFDGAARLAQPIFTEAVRPEQDELLPLLHGLAWLVTGLAAERPLALIVDDAQWADESSLACLSFVVRRLHAEPVAALIAVRPSPAGSRTATLLDGLDHVSIPRLSPGESSDLGGGSRSLLLTVLDLFVRRVVRRGRHRPRRKGNSHDQGGGDGGAGQQTGEFAERVKHTCPASGSRWMRCQRHICAGGPVSAGPGVDGHSWLLPRDDDADRQIQLLRKRCQDDTPGEPCHFVPPIDQGSR